MNTYKHHGFLIDLRGFQDLEGCELYSIPIHIPYIDLFGDSPSGKMSNHSGDLSG